MILSISVRVRVFASHVPRPYTTALLTQKHEAYASLVGFSRDLMRFTHDSMLGVVAKEHVSREAAAQDDIKATRKRLCDLPGPPKPWLNPVMFGYSPGRAICFPSELGSLI